MTYGNTQSDSSQCTLEFWYHMMGDHVGSLNVSRENVFINNETSIVIVVELAISKLTNTI